MRNSIIVHILYLLGFVLTPTSVNAIRGSTATFNCSATTGQCAWLVNGSLLSQLTRPDITTSSIGNTFFLHVPATEEYNNTNVTCIAAILGGDNLYSGPVVLRVQGMFVCIVAEHLSAKLLIVQCSQFTFVCMYVLYIYISVTL